MTQLVLSDLHCHNWTLFERPADGGLNGRLKIILAEIDRACDALIERGGSDCIIAGDIFHVRGSLDPEVLNPTQECIRRNLERGISFYAIPGNHDLKSKDTTVIGNAIQTLGETFAAEAAFKVITEPSVHLVNGSQVAFVPWASSVGVLLFHAEKLAKAGDVSQTDLFIHAGIDGVLPGMPDHGLSAATLAGLGFRRVFAGHYHNHRVMEGGKVVSIGATTHQTWGDVGSKAGFLLVDDAKVEFFDTHAPKFVDLSGLSETDMELECDGNYVRFRGPQMTQDEIRELRDFFKKSGALGVSIQVPKAAVSRRGATPTASGQTLDQSVAGFIDADADMPPAIDRSAVKKLALDILSDVRTVTEEA